MCMAVVVSLFFFYLWTFSVSWTHEIFLEKSIVKVVFVGFYIPMDSSITSLLKAICLYSLWTNKPAICDSLNFHNNSSENSDKKNIWQLSVPSVLKTLEMLLYVSWDSSHYVEIITICLLYLCVLWISPGRSFLLARMMFSLIKTVIAINGSAV